MRSPCAMSEAHVFVRFPVSGVGSLNGSLLVCLRKGVALVSHYVPGLDRGMREMERGVGRWGRRHILCAPSVQVSLVWGHSSVTLHHRSCTRGDVKWMKLERLNSD
ncbi:hypothetical protein [Desulfosporosinus fructosivorans]